MINPEGDTLPLLQDRFSERSEKEGRYKNMMIPINGFVDLKNSEVTSYLGLKKEFIKFLLDNGYQLYADFDTEKAVVYGSLYDAHKRDDLVRMTFKQLARRVRV